jgi:hypothetical protein
MEELMARLISEQHITPNDTAPVIGLDVKALSNIIARKQWFISADPAGDPIHGLPLDRFQNHPVQTLIRHSSTAPKR